MRALRDSRALKLPSSHSSNKGFQIRQIQGNEINVGDYDEQFQKLAEVHKTPGNVLKRKAVSMTHMISNSRHKKFK